MKSWNIKPRATAIAIAFALAATFAYGQGMTGRATSGTTQPPPSILKRVGIEQKLNQQLPLDLVFRDDTGKLVKLGDYFGQRPVVISMVYYECPMLCGEVMNGMSSVFSTLKFDIGKDYEVVTVSFDPREGPPLAAAKKRTMITRYGRPSGEAGWHFLTGEQPSIQALTDALGFKYAWDEDSKQFAHAAAIIVVTPEGKIAQYLYGVEYAPKDLRLALVQSSQNKIGNLVDQVLLYCYHYDPRTGKYGAVVSRVLQVAGVITIVILGGFLIVMFRLDPQRQHGGSDRGGKA